MFICMKCLQDVSPLFIQHSVYVKSYGECEVCGTPSNCIDFQGYLPTIKKEKVQPENVSNKETD